LLGFAALTASLQMRGPSSPVGKEDRVSPPS